MILRTLHNMTHSNIQSQRGGTLLGFVLGLVIGLVIALGVAMYVTKVPTPFSNKNQSRSADQDAVEAQQNKEWNPNAAIQSKPTAPEAPAEGTTTQSSASAPAVTADPLADMIKKQSPSAAPTASAPTAATSTPSTPSNAANDPFTYFVQAGAFKSANDADAQKAKLSMMGIEAKVSEREQAGRAIFRVRSGPFDDKEQAEKIKARLDANGMDAALVRVQR
jgi:cell division protein FtsN